MKKINIVLGVVLLAVASVAFAADFTALTSQYAPDIVADANTALGVLQTRIAGLEGGTATVTLETDKLLVGNDTSNRTAMGIAAGSEVTMTQDGTNVTLALAADVVAAAEMADADHGEVTWASGVATVDDGVIDAANLATAQQDQIAYLTIAGADLESAGTGTVTIQLKDAAGNDLAARALVRTWIGTADDFGADALTDYSVSTGTQKEEVTADAEYLAITDATGLIVMAVDNGGAATNYAWASVGGRIVATGAVVLTAP